jgi:hypothetical protein
MALPAEILDEATLLFEDVRPGDVDPVAHADFVIARVLDRGTLRSVRSLLSLYGIDRIRRFFREGGADQVSARTIPLWMAYLQLRPDECTSRSSRLRSARYWTG